MPQVTVIQQDGSRSVFSAQKGVNLRQFLLDHHLSPYTRITQRLNCGGRGLCATCGVEIFEEVSAVHWHDRLAKAFRYPRLSCQITVDSDLTIRIPDKIIWGKRLPK